MMTDWLQHDDVKEVMCAGQFAVGFGWIPYPAGYRTTAFLGAGIVGSWWALTG